MLRCAHIDMKGGEPPFAAVCTKVSYAQLVYFAKLRGQPKTAIEQQLRCCTAAFLNLIEILACGA
jgi:hypothetical protein